MTSLRILQCGPGTSIQDRGRFGWHRHGITSSGAADLLALAAANALVGNPLTTEALELVFLGATLEVLGGPAQLALAGARMPMRLDGKSITDHSTFTIEPGQRLEIGAATAGVYAILAVAGGFAIPMELGSKSLHRRAGLGGIDGKTVSAGQLIPLTFAEPANDDNGSLPPLPIGSDRPLRVVLGPQQGHATDAGMAKFLSAAFTVTNEVDRMACRLAGPAIELASGFNIVSDGIVPGSVQIPGSGLPIVMLADRQTTGGYPKIATVITPDLRLLVQRRTTEAVRFSSVTIEEAEAAYRRYVTDMTALPQTIRSCTASAADSSALLAINLAGDALSANDPTTWQR